MKKRSLYILSLLALPLALCSCSETEEAGEHDNWKERNQHYVDSIAGLANAGRDGWTKFVAYNLNDSVEASHPNNNHYIYVQKLESGTGTLKPLFNDSVRVHYMGRLIPTNDYPQGYIFDKSYTSYTLNEATDVPAAFGVKSVVPGFTTALLHMVEGDNWKVVIPHYLGYGEDGSQSDSKLEGYSALIFDIKLSCIYRHKIDTNTSWH